MSTSNIQDGKIMKENGSDTVWNVREKLQDVARIETEIVTVWIGNVADHVIVSEELGAGHVNVDVGEAATDCRILISKKLNAHVTEEIVIGIAIGIAKDGDREAMIVIAKGIVNETREIGIVIVGTERIAAIVKMKIRRRSVLRKNHWMIIQTIAIHLQRQAHILPQSSMKTITIKKWRKNTGFRRVVPIHLHITIMILYKIIDLKQYMFLSYPFFTISYHRFILSLHCLYCWHNTGKY